MRWKDQFINTAGTQQNTVGFHAITKLRSDSGDDDKQLYLNLSQISSAYQVVYNQSTHATHSKAPKRIATLRPSLNFLKNVNNTQKENEQN